MVKMGRFFFRLAIINVLLVSTLLLCSDVVAVESESAAEAIVTGLRFRTSRRLSIQSAADIDFVSRISKLDGIFCDSSCLQILYKFLLHMHPTLGK